MKNEQLNSQTDPFFDCMLRIVNRWKNAEEKRFIADTPVVFRPAYISCTLKHKNIVAIVSRNGGLTTSPDHCINRQAFARVVVGVGDISDRGGLGITFEQAWMPLEPGIALLNNLDEIMDSAYKEALSDYFTAHAITSEAVKPELFFRLSKEQPFEYYGDEKRFAVDTTALSSIIEKADRYLNAQPFIEESTVYTNITHENRRLVSFDRRVPDSITSLFTSLFSGYIMLEVRVRDSEGRLVTYTRRLAEPDGNMLCDEERVMAIASELVDVACWRTNVPVERSGSYHVVMNGRALGVLFHESLVAHLLSGRYIDLEEASTYKDKIGEKIMPSFITVIDDPTFPGGWGSFEYDEEGVPAQRVVLVENGILKTYMHDRWSAGRRGLVSNGKSRAEETRNPEPRISNLFVYSNESLKSREELIEMLLAACKRDGKEYGLFIEDGGGEVQVDTGEFHQSDFLVTRIWTDGRREEVGSCFITGNPYTMLNSIVAFGGEQEVTRGWCGASSGWVLTEEHAPWAFIENIEVHSSTDPIKRERILGKFSEVDDDDDLDEDEE